MDKYRLIQLCCDRLLLGNESQIKLTDWRFQGMLSYYQIRGERTRFIEMQADVKATLAKQFKLSRHKSLNIVLTIFSPRRIIKFQAVLGGGLLEGGDK